MQDKIFVNKALIWDYDFEGKYDTEEFRRWYIGRVLTCGTMEDIRHLGIDIIKQYLSVLNLPTKIRRFWEWYFKYVSIY